MPAAPQNGREARLLATYRDKQRGEETSRVDDPFRKIRPVLTS